ncbi:hypothetical protein OIK40_14985 [Erythrobacter sp. sf7]|uniref:HTH marR-type domain-containing protein n=1 Tax=Erythrobacter fulvus TaxID=2987523 RepID=A0ABT5JV61_9SPHN|nr:hypothetical protein [Erythrobacter fulvus]MDC8755951.1 hypothetical protein [Erythrobacter fulvus]
MTNHLSLSQDLARFEKLIETAETKTKANAPRSQAGSSEAAGAPQEMRDLFVTAARRERERMRTRAAHLPIELAGDAGWAILLDLYISDKMIMDIEPNGCGRRWNISDDTALRQIAGLIATNLVVRVHGEPAEGFRALRLTARGREAVTSILKSSA